MSGTQNTKQLQQEHVDKLRGSSGATQHVEDVLRTSDKVIARVTDGIYRQPGSALRELIANSYDADATWVQVRTDAPQFNSVSVEDNGNGMTPEVLVDLLHNIGGSSKRTERGKELGVSSSADANYSPGGRRLIGKLGIGIFSVSQLSSSFQIITKTAGEEHQTVARIQLHQYSDTRTLEGEDQIEAGRFRIWREPSADAEIHGTTISLTSIRPQARETLSSRSVWAAVDAPPDPDAPTAALKAPRYHIGRMAGEGLYQGQTEADRALPWSGDDLRRGRAMMSMVAGLIEEGQSTSNIRLSEMFDTYLQTIWNLGLALPLRYVDASLYDKKVGDWGQFFHLSNSRSGAAEPFSEAAYGKTLREVDQIPAVGEGAEFRVMFDGVKIERPIVFEGMPRTQHVLQKPLIFTGRMREEFSGFAHQVSAGPLEFHAYLCWHPRVVPADHQGALIRIYGASGTLFDPSFMSYQVAELTRLRQISCEIFITEGLEGALNIDRESFNNAHPHTIVLTRWLHSALRQVATTQKRIAAEARRRRKATDHDAQQEAYEKILGRASEMASGGTAEWSRVQLYSESDMPNASSDGIEVMSYSPRAAILDDTRKPSPRSLERAERVVSVLEVYGVLDGIGSAQRSALFGSLVAILEET